MVIYSHYVTATYLYPEPNNFRLKDDANVSIPDSSLTYERDPDWSCDECENNELWGNYTMAARGGIKDIHYELIITEA